MLGFFGDLRITYEGFETTLLSFRAGFGALLKSTPISIYFLFIAGMGCSLCFEARSSLFALPWSTVE